MCCHSFCKRPYYSHSCFPSLTHSSMEAAADLDMVGVRVVELDTNLREVWSITITDIPTWASGEKCLHTYACPFSTITSRCFQPGEGPIMGRGPLCNCEASNFMKVRFQLYVRVVYAGLQPLSVFPARMYSVSSVYTNSDRSCLI